MKPLRICLSTMVYPPEGTGGIPRQRQILARALVKQGHEVHVIVQGEKQRTTIRSGVVVHAVPSLAPTLRFSEKYPDVEYRLAHSLAIQEQVRELDRGRRVDVLDAPLWALEGFVPIYADELPVVLWLQTSFAQLIAKGQQVPKPEHLGNIAFEKESLRRARGIIADSQTVLGDFEQLYGLPGLADRARVVHLGLPDLPEPWQPDRRGDGGAEVLLVGRLEKRKGTAYIFELLPDLLRADPRLRVRFVGADNSQWDGFYQEHGLTYSQYFHQRWPGLRGRVIFEGPVTDLRLIEAYNQADLMLVPSLYESFGLIYLEAMRAGLPIVTLSLGAAPEIFPRGEQDGAVIVNPEDRQGVQAAVQELVANRQKREELGRCGRERFTATFLDTKMAEDTAAYYHEVSAAYHRSSRGGARRVLQVMEALDAGDAVSAIALRNADLLQEMGLGGTILRIHEHPDVAGKSRPLDQFDALSQAPLIFHYWNYSYIADFARSYTGRMAMHFHNITPPEFFSPGSPGYESTSRGYAQLAEMLQLFDLLIGVSTFNLETCRPYLDSPKPGIVVPPVIEAEAVRARPYDADLLARLQEQPGLKLLFVGRIARNKRQDRLIELAAALGQASSQPVWLYLVGGDQGDPHYRQELEALRAKLPHKEQVVFTGKVSDEELYSYYRAADVFVSASEHEGFGMPLIEAMALDLPVVAFAAGAVPETLGEGGILVGEWEPGAVAAQIQKLKTDQPALERLLENQRANLCRFTAEAVKARLNAVVRFLHSGAKDEALFFDVG